MGDGEGVNDDDGLSESVEVDEVACIQTLSASEIEADERTPTIFLPPLPERLPGDLLRYIVDGAEERKSLWTGWEREVSRVGYS